MLSHFYILIFLFFIFILYKLFIMNYLIIIIFILIFLLILINLFYRPESFIINSRRKVKISVPNEQILIVKKIMEEHFKKEFDNRNVDIEYVVSTPFTAELYDYDGKLKKTITKINEIIKLIIEIDNMSKDS
jgi:hypothetical protein